MKESYSDFSIVRAYVELKKKYETEVKSYSSDVRNKEEQFKKHSAALEQEVAKRNDYIKAQEKKIQELTQMISEKDEQLRTLGLQLHKMKLASSAPETRTESEESAKKRGLFK